MSVQVTSGYFSLAQDRLVRPGYIW